MRTLFQLLGDVVAQRPGDLTERLTPWILIVFGGAFLAIMLFAYMQAVMS